VPSHENKLNNSSRFASRVPLARRFAWSFAAARVCAGWTNGSFLSTAQAASLYGNVDLTNNFNDGLVGPLNSQTSG
jgi:hypothetical protein